MKILFFAGLREALGTSSIELSAPEVASIATIGALRDHLAARGEPWAALATMKNLRAAVNQQMVPLDAPVSEGDEVAFFPPVTGG